MRATTYLFLFAVAAGCGPSKGELEDHRQQWAKSAPAAYRYTFTPRGFLMSAHMQVTVRGGAVVDTTIEGASSRDIQGQTVEQLFDDVALRLDRSGCSTTVDYDAALGYPRDVYSDCGQEGDGWLVEDLSPVE